MSEFRTSEEIARDLIPLGVKKAGRSPLKMIGLAVLAGFYIGFAAHLATVAGTGDVEWVGAKKIFMGSVFSLGLMLVLIPGAELFTGNCLMVPALLEKKISLASMFRNWVLVWLGNFAGAFIMAFVMVKGTGLISGEVARTAVSIAAGKCSLSGSEIIFRGIGANWLVCLAVLMAMSSRNTAGKILGMFFPVMAFVAMGFEHSIANMYFIPAGFFIKSSGILLSSNISAILTPGNGLFNILLATLGNIVGGVVFVGAAYWFIYVRKIRAT